MTVSVSLLPAPYLDRVRADLLKYLKKSEIWSGGRADVDDIINFVRSGRMHLWIVQEDGTGKIRGYVITEITVYPQCAMLTVQYCAGDTGVLVGSKDVVFSTLERFAKDGGCAGMEFFGRKGWLPWVKTLGYRANMTIFEKYFP